VIGKTLAHYEVLSKLGEGGMGAVYLARDTKLGREVALKILPDHFAKDADRLARFHREARTLAALNHPNIAAIHGLESDQGVHFLVMELADGDDLSERIAKGPIPVDEALAMIREIAQGLEEAHQNGIIHRDLKPANVKVSADGKVKVLDFGLARAYLGESTAEEETLDSPTITAAMTGAGVILGTAAYMSPEQARGTPLDRRSDIWSFGVVLYEMLTGKRLFQGETVSDTLAGILKSDPDWDALPDDIPDTVRLLLVRCLERDRQQRLQDIGEARILLSGDGSSLYSGLSMTRVLDSDVEVVPASRRPMVAFAVVAGILGIVLGGLAMRSLTPEAPPVPRRHLEVASPQIGEASADAPMISPDGTMAVYVLDHRLWLRRFDTGATLELTGTDGAETPFWSPDSEHVGYFIKSRIMRVAATGGAPQMVCELAMGRTGSGASWSETDHIVFSTGDSDGVLSVPARGGVPSSYMLPDTSFVQDIHDPYALTGERGLLFSAHIKDASFTRVYHHRDGQDHLVFDADENRVYSPVWCESGHVLYRMGGANDGIWAIKYDLDTFQVGGDPFLVIGHGRWPSVSQDGTLVCVTGGSIDNWQLVRCDSNGRVLETYGEPQSYLPFFSLDPGEGRIAFCLRDESDSQLWMLDLTRRTQSRLTFDKIYYGMSTWTPDGNYVIASSGASGGASSFHFRQISVDGTTEPQLLTKGNFPTLTPDGKTLVYCYPFADTSWDLSFTNMDALDPADPEAGRDREPDRSYTEASWQYGAEISPDGRLMAYVSRETGRDEIYLRRYPEGDQKRQVSVDSGGWPQWNAAGDRLYFMSGLDVMEVEIETQPSLRIGNPRTLFTRPRGADTFGIGWPLYLQVNGDGTSFYMLQATDEEQGNRPLTLVQNWVRE